jgi:hypothetical protein
VGRNLTPLRNRYFVLKWDFSLHPGPMARSAISKRPFIGISMFVWPASSRTTGRTGPATIRLCASEDALTSFESVLAAVDATPYKLYLLIDEYDNFANEVLMADRPGSRDRYQTLLQGEGLFKSVFKAVKAGAGGLGVDRVFITGVSPVVLSDMTSGYNVGEGHLSGIPNSTTCAASPRPR